MTLSSNSAIYNYSSIDYCLNSKTLKQYIRKYAEYNSVPFTSLYVRTLLHLPRLSLDQITATSFVENKIREYAEIQSAFYRAATDYIDNYVLDLSSCNLNEFALVPTNDRTYFATYYMLNFLHYLNSPRQTSINLNLVHLPTTSPVGVITLSPFDLTHVDVSPLSHDEVIVMSRIYTLDYLPRNALSFFIGMAKRWIMTNFPSVQLLLTYLNMNLGFTGSIYRATNWVLYAYESNVRYNYINGFYVTDRLLIEQFGTAKQQLLEERKVRNLSFSTFPLHPLMIYACTPNNRALAIDSVPVVDLKRN